VIQFGSGFDVVGDVCDVDTDLHVAVGKFAKGDGIVKIASGVGIDGDDKFPAEILAARWLVGQFNFGKRGGLGDGFGRKLGGKIKLPDDGEDVHAGIGVRAEALHDDSLRIGVTVFPLDEPGDHLVAGLSGRGALGSGGGDVEVMEEAGIVRNDDMEAGGFLECADDVGGAAFQYAENATATAFCSIGTAGSWTGVLRPAIQTSHNQIAVQGIGGVLGGNMEIRRSVLGQDKGKAFGVELNRAGDQIGVLRGDPVVLANARDPSLFFKDGEGADDGSRWNTEATG
jgi:hypothetical protein